MNKRWINFMLNPFERIAGLQALAWGFLGFVLSVALGYFTGYHYHGLLHYGVAPNPAWWCFVAEHLVVWLIPASLFWLGGLAFSRSRIRAIDIFGTTLFAQIPLLFTNVIVFSSFYKKMTEMGSAASIEEQVAQVTDLMLQPGFWIGVWFSLVITAFVVWMCYWLFKAFEVSCNLKGKALWIVYFIVLFGGDFLCRIIISQLLYK